MLNWGLIFFIFLMIISIFIVFAVYSGSTSGIPANSMILTGILTSILAIILTHISYPRISNIKIIILGIIMSISVIAYFIIINFMNEHSRITVSLINFLYIYQFFIIILCVSLPSFIRSSHSKFTLIFLIAVELLIMFAILNSNIKWHFIADIRDPSNILPFSAVPCIAFIITLGISIINKSNHFHIGGFLSGLSLFMCISWIFFTDANGVNHFDSITFAIIPLILFAGIIVHWISRISHMAFYDPMLRIYNRAYCNKIINEEISVKKNNIAVIMIDIDHFKKINDTFGHSFGDKMLIHISQLLTQKIVPNGILCRYGGEEFIVFYNFRSKTQLINLVEELRITVSKSKLRNGKNNIKANISIGSAYTINRTIPYNEMIEIADKALYKSKNTGRNKVTIKSIN